MTRVENQGPFLQLCLCVQLLLLDHRDASRKMAEARQEEAGGNYQSTTTAMDAHIPDSEKSVDQHWNAYL